MSIQKNANFFYVIDMKITYNKEHTYGFFLLKLEDKEVKTKKLVNQIYTENTILDDAAISKTAKMAIDCVVVSWKDDNHPDTAALLLPINAQSRPYRVTELDDSHKSISKCDGTLFGMEEDSFQITTSTKGAANSCLRDDSLPVGEDQDDETGEVGGKNQATLLPFKFKGKKLLRQAKELIVNTWHSLGQPREPEFFNQKPVEITAALLNLGKTTVEDVIRQFKRGEAFSNSIKRKRVCPVTEIDDQEKILLYKIITTYYKNNDIPKAEEMRRDFIKGVREHRKKILEAQRSVTASSESPISDSSISAPTQITVQGVTQNLASVSSEPNEDCLDNEYTCCAKSFSKILSKNGYR